VIVDTSAAFNEFDEENSNNQQKDHAQMLRSLIEKIPGRPTVLVLCHPAKSASDDNLVPRGGGSFLGEIDGNMGCKMNDKVVELKVVEKWRGGDFNPFLFRLREATAPELKDSRGRHFNTVVAEPITDVEKKAVEEAARRDVDRVLAALDENPNLSLRELCNKLQWYASNGNPQVTKAGRAVNKLLDQKLIKRLGDRVEVTREGAKYLKMVT
jgi:hypothetical protein